MGYNFIKGDKFGKLTIIGLSEKKGARGNAMYDCICECGKTKTILARSLNIGHTKTCGKCREISIGDKFGNLTVLKRSEINGPKGSSRYECICDCGRVITTQASRLKNGMTKTCGNCNEIFSGDKFGKLTVVKKFESGESGGQSRHICICDCGNEVIVLSSHLKNGHTKTCGKCPLVFPGEVYGKLTVVERFYDGKTEGPSRYLCVCNCGNNIVVRGTSLKSGNSRSCGKCNLIILEPGFRSGKLTVFKKTETKNRKNVNAYDCICDCGNQKSVSAYYLYHKKRISCGCLSKHSDREYAIIHNIYNRCIVSASKRLGLDYDITVEELSYFIKQKCFYCGTDGSNTKKDWDYSRGIKVMSNTIVN